METSKAESEENMQQLYHACGKYEILGWWK